MDRATWQRALDVAAERPLVRAVLAVMLTALVAGAGVRLAWALPGPSFSFTPTAPTAGDPVSFSNGSFTDTGVTVDYSWDFGDGSGTVTDVNPVHAFRFAGQYVVTLIENEHTFTGPTTSATTTAALDVAPVPNDNWANAKAFDPLHHYESGNNAGATTEANGGEPCCFGNTVWYAYSAARTGNVALALDTSYTRASLAVYTGAALDSLTQVAVQQGSPSLQLTFAATAGTTYWVQVGTFDDSGGPYVLAWMQNDTLATAQQLQTDQGFLLGTTMGATGPDPGEPNPFDASFANTVWFAWTPSTTGTATLASDADFKSAIAVYTDDGTGGLVPLASNSGSSQFNLQFQVLAGAHYDVQVGTYGDSPGAFGLTWTIQGAQTTTTATTTAPATTTEAAPSPPSFVPPDVSGSAASGIGQTSATVSASIDPKGGPTRWSLNYGTSTSYDRHVGPTLLDTATEPRTVSQTLSGLAEGTTYHFQFVATNDAGTTTGPDLTFTTAGATTTTPGAPPPPEQGKSVDVFVFSGIVLVNGLPLTSPSQIAVGSTIDTTHGTVTLESVGPGGNVQFASFAGGVFVVQQPANGITVLQLTGGNFDACTSKRTLSAKPKPKPAPSNKTAVRDLWGNGTGSFQTKGRFAAATVRGTVWHIVDRCDGTLVVVVRGLVAVNDLVRHKTVLVSAGHQYFAARP